MKIRQFPGRKPHGDAQGDRHLAAPRLHAGMPYRPLRLNAPAHNRGAARQLSAPRA